MATQVPAVTANPGNPGTFTKEALLQAINEAAEAALSKGIGPAIDKALAPLTKEQNAYLQRIMESAERTEKRAKQVKDLGLEYVRTCRAYALASKELGRPCSNPEEAMFHAKKFWGDGDVVVKSLQASVAAQAGNMIRPDWASEWIELLRNKTIMRQIVGQVLPMAVGSLTVRRQSAAATSSYVGESVYVTPSQQSVDLLTLNYKKLMSITPVSNDLLRFAGSEADTFVRNDLLLVSKIREDLAFLRGDGTQQTPTGCLSLIATGNLFNQAGTTLANVQSDLAKAIRLVQEANVPLENDNGYWVMCPRTYWGIYNLVATTGNYVFAPELREKGTLLGYKVFVTNQVPKNLSGTQSETYFLHGPSLLIGDALVTQIQAFPGGAYYDGANVISGISKDETVIQLIAEHDFSMRHNTGGSVIQAVTIS